ncbi:MAG: L,D-transpeptidase family protein [Acetobacter sp.]|uniref:L,D-transpeptidase family protein n=1 Tax=Acetobacter sp. TaxID=440 RepID=UPI003F91B78B
MMIHVHPAARSNHNAQLHCGHKIMTAIIGKNGVTPCKQEGDNATPLGLFPLRRVFYRADKIARPQTCLPTEAISRTDGWCDDSTSPYYNEKLTLPNQARHEILWRDDDVYDIIVVIGYNDDPVQAGRGSAIFMHKQRPDRSPTEGCVALSESDLLAVLASQATHILIHAPT